MSTEHYMSPIFSTGAAEAEQAAWAASCLEWNRRKLIDYVGNRELLRVSGILEIACRDEHGDFRMWAFG